MKKNWLLILLFLLIVIFVFTIFRTETPPEIVGFTPKSPEVTIGDSIPIQVNFARNNNQIKSFQWVTKEGLIRDNGNHIVSYQAPSTPGDYKVYVQLQYSGNTLVQDAVTVKVLPTSISVTTPTVTIDSATNQQNTPIPTFTSQPTKTPTVATNTLSPTSTIIKPTDSIKPSNTPTETIIPMVTPTLNNITPTTTPTKVTIPSASSTPKPIYTSTPLPIVPVIAPILIYPKKNANISNKEATFIWEMSGNLTINQAFEVRIWQEGDPHYGAYDARETDKDSYTEGNQHSLTFNVADAHSVSLRGNGNYFWSVAVVQINPYYKDIGIESEPRPLLITIFGSSDDSSPLVRPTRTAPPLP